VRPTRVLSLMVAVLVALGGIVLFVYLLFINRPQHVFWFQWIAVLLALGFAGMFLNLAVQYWIKVGRLEARGRPRSE
jgi:hypothetical protein